MYAEPGMPVPAKGSLEDRYRLTNRDEFLPYK